MGGALKIGGVEYPAGAEVGERLERSSAYLSDSLVAESLGVDTITAVVRDQTTTVRLLSFAGVLAAAEGKLLAGKAQALPLDERAQYGDGLEYTQGEQGALKLRVESVERVGRDTYQVFGISPVGLLLSSDHYGGVYSGETAAQVIADIVGVVFPYVLDPVLGATPLFGWLPKQSRRDALRDVLFAIGGQVHRDAEGTVVIAGQAAAQPYEIAVDEFYMGGSVTGGNPATGVDVTEHTFMKTQADETVTLFDGDAAAEPLLTPGGLTVTGVLVGFGEPMHDLSAENTEILESGANYAVLGPSPAAVLTGKAYTHTKRIISRRKPTAGAPNVITSHSCTLVNLMNAELVADRLMAYFGTAKTVTANIVATAQKPGDAVSFVDPFGDAREGYIRDMALTMSGIMAANTTIATGFIPTASGNYYSRLVVLTGSGDWIVPEDCRGKIRVVLIGGGQGGQGGTGGNGAVYQLHSSDSEGSPIPFPDTDGVGAEGGKPGTPGAGGRVFVVTIPVTPGQSISFRAGAGGEGGLGGGGGVRYAYEAGWDADPDDQFKGTEGLPGEDGEDSTFGEFSSADGKIIELGYVEITTGTLYAPPGAEGVAGGKGGGVYGGQKAGESVGEWAGGLPGESLLQNNPSGDVSEPDFFYVAQGGGGGGAAYGCDGYNGENASFYANGAEIQTGAGGNGGNAIKAADGKVFGAGGQAGHGGGGAGNVGAGYGGWYPVNNYNHHYGKAMGGSGGQGGKGAPGAILIYY